MRSPLFIPFNIRNKIINENCTKQKDISEFPTNKQYQILLSYMPEKNIYAGIQKRINDKLYNKKTRNSFSTPYEVYKNGWDEDQIKEWIRTHPIKGSSTTLLALSGSQFASVNRGAVLNVSDTDLKTYQKFDESAGDIINLSQSTADLGSAADMQIVGATYSQTGKVGNSLSFDGTDDKGTYGSSLSQFNFLHNSTSLWTIIFWMKLGTAAADRLFSTGDSEYTVNEIGIGMSTSTTKVIHVTIGNGTASLVIDSTTTNDYIPDTTNWYYYVISYDQGLGSNNLKLKRNDANLEQFSKTVNAPSNSNAAQALVLAALSTSRHLHANFDEVSIWNKVVSGADQTTLYNSGNGLAIYA